MNKIDAMLKEIETKRSSIGTAANRLESVLALQQAKIANYASSKSTIMDADIIHIIDKGKVVASGTHDELLKINKIYKNLYETESLNS